MDSQLTVIVPTRNRRPRLRECLDGLLRQTLPPDLAIVVNDGGRCPQAVVSEFRDRLPVRLIHTQGVGPAAARNAAIAEARTTYVGFLDDDSVPVETWAAACVRLFERAPQVTAQLGRLLWSGERRPESFRRRFVPQLRQKIYDSRHLKFTDPQFCQRLREELGP